MIKPFENKKIVLGVTGSVASYKAIEIASKLTQSGAVVDVVLTHAATKFVSPLAFQSVTGRKAYTDEDLWSGEGHVVHINLGHTADLLVIAPVSANTMAKLAHGICDNLLTVTALASNCPLILAPAMDAGMFSREATQANVKILQKRGVVFIGPAAGHLASGMIGVGRLEEPSVIFNHIRKTLSRNGPLSGKKIVVTAGPTQESIDPVRFITNHSSGKQGFAIAQAAVDLGADVTLISGPTCLDTIAGVELIKIKSVEELCQAVLSSTETADVLIMAAAPADFTPKKVSEQKVKKDSGFSSIELEQTIDILRTVSARKNDCGYPKKIIGFAAESQSLLENATKKLKEKKLDLIVANDISLENAGFRSTTNQVTLIYPDGKQISLPMMEKTQVANRIMEQIIQWQENN